MYEQPRNIIAELEARRLQALQGGSVTSESNDIKEIIDKVLAHTISEEQAIAKLDSIEQGRQDYH